MKWPYTLRVIFFSTSFFLTFIYTPAQIAEEIVTENTECPDDGTHASLVVATATNATCGFSNGEIALVGEGGTGTYQFSITADNSDWQSSPIFKNVAPGTYPTFIRDVGADCRTSGYPIEVMGYTLSISVGTRIHPRCNLNNGSLSLSGNGGDGNYEFGLLEQNDFSRSIPQSWSSSGQFLNLMEGNYRTFVRNAIDNSCITEGPLVNLTNQGKAPELTIISPVKHTGCGQPDGRIELSGSGGTGSFLFRLNDLPWQESSVFDNLESGFYTPQIKNNVAGTAEACRVVGEEIQIRGSELLSISVVNYESTNCGGSNGLIELQGNGSEGTYEYRMNLGQWQLSPLFLNLSPGEYTAYVRSSTDLACVVSEGPIDIAASETIEVQLQGQTNPTICGAADGSIIFVEPVSGRDYKYRLNQGIWQDDPHFTNLVSGLYVPWISDGTCQFKGTSITLTSDDDIQLEITSTDIPCFGDNVGEIFVNVPSGQAPFSYQWSGPTQIGNSAQAQSLSAGQYTVTVTDANQCETSANIDISQPSPLNLTFISKPASSNTIPDGHIEVNVVGGSGPYNVNWSTGASTSLLTGLEGGKVYSVTVTDVNSCTSSGSHFLQNLCETGCDEKALTILDKQICQGETYSFYGQVLSQSGSYIHEYTSPSGTSLLIQLNLEVTVPVETTIAATILSCDTYQVGDEAFNTAGTHVVVISRGDACDSTVILNLSVTEVDIVSPDQCSTSLSYRLDDITGKDAVIKHNTKFSSPDEDNNYGDERLRAALTFVPDPATGCNDCFIGTNHILIDFAEVRSSYSDLFKLYEANSIRLQLYSTYSSGAPLLLTPITENWDENNVTWNTAPNSDLSRSIQFSVNQHNNSDGVMVEIDVTDLVIEMATKKNLYGFKIYLNTSVAQNSRFTDFIHSEDNRVDKRPTLIFDFGKTKTTNIALPMCEGQSVRIGDEIYTSPGSYEQYLTTKNGCDSLLKIDLFHNEVERSEIKLCEGDIFLQGDDTYSEPGHYIIPVLNGGYCERNISLEIIDTHNVYLEKVIRHDGSFAIGDQVFTETGRYVTTIESNKGCDSVVTLDLIRSPEVPSCLEPQTVQPGAVVGKDAVVNSNNPNHNFSTSFSAGNYPTFQSFALIDFPQIREQTLLSERYLTSATFSLFVTGKSGNKFKIKLFPITSKWDEQTVTWNSRPEFDDGNFIEVDIKKTNEFVEIDVTDFVRGIQNGRIFGFLIQCTPNSISFRSSDDLPGYYQNQFPKLDLIYDNSVATREQIITTSLCFDGKVTVDDVTYTSPGVYFQAADSEGCETLIPVVVKEGNTKIDYNALAALYFSTGGAEWLDNSGWLTECDVCDWYGITCDSDKRIIEIKLPNNGLTGGLNGEIFGISTVEKIDLSNNSLSDELPEVEIFSDPITSIKLKNNQLTGKIPSSYKLLCEKVIDFDVYGNQLDCDFDEFCQGRCADCFTIGKDCLNADCYAWKKDDVILEGETSSTLEVCLSEPGVYQMIGLRNGEIVCEEYTRIGEECNLDVSIISDKKAFCHVGESITLRPNKDFASYSWRAGEGVTWPKGDRTIKSTSVKQIGSYILTVKDENDCFAQDVIYLGEGDPVNLTVQNFDPGLCPGTDFVLTALTDGDKVEWKDQDMNLIAEGSSLNGLQIPETTSAILVVSSNASCVSQTPEFPFDVPYIEISATQLHLCSGESAVLSVAGSGIGDVVWVSEGQEIGTTSSVTVTEAGTYSVNVSNISGTCALRDEVNISSSNSPVLNLITIPLTICTGEEVKFFIDGADNYNWSAGTPQSDGRINTDFPTETMSYSVTGFSASGCSSTVSQVVTVVDEPAVNAGDDRVACPGEEITLTATGTGTTYEWLRKSDLQLLGVGSTLLHSFEESTELLLRGDNGTCPRTDEISISITDFSVEVFAEVTTICSGSNIVLSAEASPGAQLTWFRDGIDISLATSDIVVTEAGTYRVDATMGGCTLSDEVTIEQSTGGDPTLIQSYFSDAGFYQLPIIIGSEIPDGAGWTLVDDRSRTEIQIQDIFFDPASLVEDVLIRDYFDSQGDVIGVITKNENFCDGIANLNAIRTLVEEKEWGFWLHVFENPAGQDFLFIGTKNPDFPNVMGAIDADHLTFIETSKSFTEMSLYYNPFSSKDEEILNALLFDISAQIVSYSHIDASQPARNLQEGCFEVEDESIFISPAGISSRLIGGDLACSNPKIVNGDPAYANGCLGAIFRINDDRYDRHLALGKGDQFLGYAFANKRSETAPTPISRAYFFLDVNLEDNVADNEFLETHVIYRKADPILTKILFKSYETPSSTGKGTFINSLGQLADCCIRLSTSGLEYDGRIPLSGQTLEDRVTSTTTLRNANLAADRLDLLNDLASNTQYNFHNYSNANFELQYFEEWFEDKLNVLFNVTGKSFKVVIFQKEYPLEEHQLESVAIDVHNSINSGASTATLFVHLHEDIFVSFDDLTVPQISILLPQFFLVNDNAVVEDIPDPGASSLQKMLMQHYSGIRKPYHQFVYKDLPGQNREVSERIYKDETGMPVEITGMPAIYDFIIWKYKQQTPDVTSLPNVTGYDKTLYQLLNESLDNINDPTFFDIWRETNLMESCVEEYSHVHARDLSERSAFINYFSTYVDQDCLFEKNDLATAVIYPLLDGLSFIPIVGIIPDFAGMALAQYRGEYVRALVYGTGIVLHFSLGGQILEPAITSGLRGIISKNVFLSKGAIGADDIAEQILLNIGQPSQLSPNKLNSIVNRIHNSDDAILDNVLSPSGYKALEAAGSQNGKKFQDELDIIFATTFKAADDIFEILRARFKEIPGADANLESLVSATTDMLQGFHPGALSDVALKFIVDETDNAIALLSKIRAFDDVELFTSFSTDLEIGSFFDWVNVDPARADAWKYFYETTDELLKLNKTDPIILDQLFADLPEIRSFLDGGVDKVKAWKALFSSPSIRKNVDNLKKIDDQVTINNTQYDRIKQAFDEAPDKQKFIDELQPKKTFHDNPADDVNGPIADSPEQIDELVVTNNPVNNTSKKFWWNHESNVNTHLDEIYGADNVGRQITVDITTTTETFTVRLDNMIDEVGGKINFKIGDAKSSINNNLSAKTPEQLRNSMSTGNQKKLYDALQNGTLTQAKPRGARARQFFNVNSNDDLPFINLSKKVDFYVNDSPASAGYNIYKKTLEL